MTSLSVTAPTAPGSGSGPGAPSPSPNLNDHHGNSGAGQQDDPVLTFTDVPSELFKLRPPDLNSRQHPNLSPPTIDHYHHHQHRQHHNNPFTSSLSSTIPQPPPPPPPPPPANATSAPNTSPSASHPQPRKPSPGLAARLKALGFGGQRKASPPPSQFEHIGRLPEEQLRKLEQEHQSAAAHSAVERRGRPWKGVIARIPSRSSLKSSKGTSAPDSSFEAEPLPPVHDGATAALAAAAATTATAAATAAEPRQEFLLPEIETSTTPPEMDTQKYRLPDHINGNGVKVQLGTRDEHLSRDAGPPDAPDALVAPPPPPPPPKDSPPLPATNPAPQQDILNTDSIYFNPLGLQRPGSIYTLSRASFANQLAQLTSIQLPDAESLSSKVSAIPTAQAATKALIGAAEQIRGWIHKATEVIGGLESEDDVEWSAAGGREGVEEVENAILRFEELINVYVSAIEELQGRDDIPNVSTDDLNKAVTQMEAIMNEWTNIRVTLRSVKAQVEIAMEWEELWDMVLGDIQNEMDDLSRLVFEMEERRHRSIMAAANGDGVDIGDLETIVEETPPAATRLQAVNNRFSLPAFPVSPGSPSPSSAAPPISQDDSSLLALFARMQPLRASLDFLPMRLSVFEARAERIFPTACEELEMRRAGLDGSYKKLEKDADSLRKELGEDRWVLVFRGAGRQAQKMYESVERSVGRLKEGIDGGMHLTNQPAVSKKIESYEAKKTHYGPAIERVLGIVDKGIKDRLTVNGEILRLHDEMQTKWEELKERMAEMDMTLEELQSEKKGQQLRDSVSSMLSNDRSTVASGNDTPGSSPPSSVVMSSLGLGKAPTPGVRVTKPRSTSVGSHLPQPNRRNSSLPAPDAQVTTGRKPITSRMSTLGLPSRETSATPSGKRLPPRPNSTLPGRPRWNASTNASDVDTGHNFKPLSLTAPSPYSKKSPNAASNSSLTPASALSKLPLRSPLSRAASSSPIPEDTPTKPSSSRFSFRGRGVSPGPPAPPKATRPTLGSSANRRASFQPQTTNPEGSPVAPPRPASSLSSTRRSSLLPQPRARGGSTGRESPQAVAGARSAMRCSSAADTKRKDFRPKWRP